MFKEPVTTTKIKKLKLYFVKFIDGMQSDMYIAADSFEWISTNKYGIKSIEFVSENFEQADIVDIFFKNS